MILLSCSLPAMASDIEPGELPGATVETYPEDLPVFLNDTGIVILSQPNDVYGQIDDQLSLSVVAIGEITSYQWQFARANSSNWTDCTSTTLGYNTSVVQPVLTEKRDGYRYRCIISNSLGFVVSDFATIRIGVPPVADNSFSIGDILGLFNTGATAVVHWFSSIMDSTGAGTVYIAMMSVVLSVAILLGPLLGSARSGLSDVVHRPRHKEDDK